MPGPLTATPAFLTDIQQTALKHDVQMWWYTEALARLSEMVTQLERFNAVVIVYDHFENVQPLIPQLPFHPLLVYWHWPMSEAEGCFRLGTLVIQRDELAKVKKFKQNFLYQMAQQARKGALGDMVDTWHQQTSQQALWDLALPGLRGFFEVNVVACYRPCDLADTLQRVASAGVYPLPDTWSVREFPQHAFPNQFMTNAQGDDMALLPFRFEQQLAGILVLVNQHEKHFSDEDKGFLKEVAYQFGEAMVQVSRYERANERSLKDRLTGLANRMALEERLKAHFDPKSGIQPEPLGLLMLDIDHFKKFNDNYGHQVGDEVLKAVGNALKKLQPQSGFTFRFGGEELGMVITGVTRAQLWKIADRVRLAVSQVNLGQVPGIEKLVSAEVHKKLIEDVRITVSAGCSIYPQDFDESRSTGDFAEVWERLLQKSDGALYKAKQQGRNRVHLYEPFSFNRATVRKLAKPWVNDMRLHHAETYQHLLRVALTFQRFLRYLKFSKLHQTMGFWQALLHDVGKLDMASALLGKQSALTVDEFEQLKTHARLGYERVKERVACKFALDTILHHHERWDGGGYPDGLQGEQIPFFARIMTLVDSYDVMRYGRSYQKARPPKDIEREIEQGAGSQFDPDLALMFLAFLRRQAT